MDTSPIAPPIAPDEGVPPPPPGFDLTEPPKAATALGGLATTPTPPPGFDYESPPTEIPSAPDAAKAAEATTPASAAKPSEDEDTPGFWHTITSAFSKRMAEQAASDVAGTKVILPKGLGGSTYEEQYQEGRVHPKTKDAVDKLLDESISEGWDNPKWWAAQLAGNIGGVAPGLGTAVAATAVGGPIAGIAAFGLEAGLSRLVPAYNAGRAAGLSPSDSITRSLVDTGITASFATAMGLVGKFPLTGTLQQEINGEVATLLKRPVLEAMAQIGLVQPSLMAGQDIITDLSHGEAPNAEQVLTDMAVGGLAGFGIHETFHGLDKAKGLLNARAEMMAGRAEPARTGPASAEAIAAAAEAQRPKGPTDRPAEGREPPRPSAEPAAPVGPPPGPGDQDAPLDGAQYERDVIPKPGTGNFFSAVKEAVINKLPDSFDPRSALNTIAKQPYVTREEMAWLDLRKYLLDVDGKANKKDLLAHIESKEVQLEEVPFADTQVDPMQKAHDLYDHYVARYGSETQSNWPSAAQQHMTQVFNRAMAEAADVTLREPQWRNQNPPGAKNIREFVLKVPAPDLDPAAVEGKAKELWDEKNLRKYGPWEGAAIGDKERFREGARTALYSEDPRVYVGKHYNVPNGFAHMRLADYTDRNGRRLLGLMEGQSDLHQEAQGTAAKPGPGYQTRGLLTPDEAIKRVQAAERIYQRERQSAMEREPGKYSEDNPRVRAARQRWFDSINDLKAANQNLGKLPDLPFKTSWQELLVKRMLQLAADEGYDGVFWLNGDQVGMRLENAQQVKGARQHYNHTFQNLFQKWAHKVGSNIEPTRIAEFPKDWQAHINSLVPFRRDALNALHLDLEAMKNNMWMPIGPEHSSLISKGMPLFDEDVKPTHPVKGTRTLSDVVQTNPNAGRLLPAARKIDKFIRKIANEFKISRGITFVTRPMPDKDWRGRLVPGFDPATGNYVVEVNLSRILTEHDLYAAMSHEFGHVIYDNVYLTSTDAEKAAIEKAYSDFRAKIPGDQMKMEDFRRLRDNAISEMTGARAMHNDLRISDLTPGSKAYILGKEEWFVEQVAKWMTTDAKPLGVAEKFFKRLANKIRKMIATFTQGEYGPRAKPDKAVQDFLDARYGMPSAWMEAPTQQFEMDTKKKASAAFDKEGAPETKAVPQQASSDGGRNIIAALPPELRGNGEAMAAHGDRMNWFYKIFTSLPQIQALNPHLRELALYTDMHRVANWEKNQIMSEAQTRDQQWATIRDPKQLTALTNFISDYANGLFKLPHTEDGVFRRPNPEEFAALVKKHGLSDQSLKVFQSQVQALDGFLEKYRSLLIEDARRIKDPTRQRVSIENINSQMDKLLQRPFMPLTRFGKYSITVYGSDNKIRHYEQTNSLRRQKQIHEALEQHVDRLPGDRVVSGMVPKDVRPFLGMPPGLIDLISEKLSLSTTQRAALDQLKFDYAPAQTFKHQFRNLDLTPGYSTDFRRAAAHFFFHGANHITRIKWADAMRDQIAALGSEKNRLARAGEPGGVNKLDKIVKYVQAHFDAFIDPKSDWAALRGVMFHWYLGFNPASAVVNLTQTPLMTYPYLAAVYGDLAATRAMAKASVDLNNFYRKTTLTAAGEGAKGVTGYEAARARALGNAVSRGVLSETQAHQLAALAEDRNLLRIFGTKAEKFWLRFQEGSSWMFEASEQWNRRLAFAAAWDLAYSRPGHASIQDAIRTYPILYSEMIDKRLGKGMEPHEAGAFLAAMKAVEQTQFNYSPYARPPIMRGKIGGSVFVFKLFTQNTMFNLLSHPAMLARWALVMGALGGLQGMMGFENVNSLLKTLAYRLFGKDFDLEDEARHFAHDVLNDTISPDLLMHGLSSKGFGIPAVMHSMGWNSFPTVDMSKSVGLGDVIGFDPFKPLGPTKQPRDEEFRQLSRATGAAFGLPLSIYDFASSSDNLSDLKKYESIMPRWLGSLSHAYRFATRGAETNRAGNAVVRFDPADTEQMMEILARAAGFQPRRLTEEWSRISATAEAAAFWDLRRQGLMRQFADAIKNSDEEGRDRVVEAIKNYNQTLPEEARGKAITGKELRASVQQRMKVRARQEAGLPAQKSNIPISQEMEKYYPRGWPRDLQDAKPVQ